MAKQTQIELLAPDLLGVTFAYQAGLVRAIKQLASRRWNPKFSRWEVHLTHLGELMRIFMLDESAVEPAILEAFRACAGPGTVRVEMGVLQARLEGGALPLAAIDAVTSYPVPGYQFSPRFKSGQWDGYKHLFSSRSLTFPAGLWPRVRQVLEEQGFKIELVRGRGEALPRRRASPSEHCAPRPAATPLRPYQQSALDRALAAGRGVIQIPTGGGKTLLAAHLIQQIGHPAFFLVHTLDLLYQSAEVFARELGVEVGILGDGQANLRPLTVATIQTLCRAFDDAPAVKKTVARRKAEEDEEAGRPERELELDDATREQVIQALDRAGAVIFDECHHLPADSFYKIAMHTRSARWRFGLSATPWRDDHQDLLLEAALGPTVSVTRFSDLIELGFLVPPRIEVARPPMPQFRGARPTYATIYKSAIVENQQRNRVIAARAEQWAAQGCSVLILVTQKKHGDRLQTLLPQARFVYGALDSETRRQALADLEQKLHPIMIATTLADEGLDLPSLGGVILAGGGRSATRTYQRIGRALRPAAGKTEARVLDFMDDAVYLRQHSDARVELYRQEPSFQVRMD